MKGMVIDPRGRLQRRWFLYDLILPNIAAIILIVILRVIDLPLTDVAIGGIAIVLLWSANVAAPISRLHDLGVPAIVHFIVVGVVFLLGTVGPIGSFDELSLRVADWTNVLQGGDSQVPEVGGNSGRIAGLIAFVQILVLALAPGQKGDNRFGPDPRNKS